LVTGEWRVGEGEKARCWNEGDEGGVYAEDLRSRIVFLKVYFSGEEPIKARTREVGSRVQE
jgi:hypothetical protein